MAMTMTFPTTVSAATAAISTALLAPSTAVAFIIPPISSPQPSLLGAPARRVHLFREDGASFPASGADNDRGGGHLQNATTSINSNDDYSSKKSSTNNIINDNNIDEADVVGAGTLGDIMAGSGSKDDITNCPSPTTVIDGLVTKEGGELNARFDCDFTPMERIALTANGNLQRIFSSYYDAPVHVHVDSCTRRKKNNNFNSNEKKGDGMIPQNQRMGFNHSSIDFDPTIHRPEMLMSGDAIWDRVVHIQVHDQTICKATSIISVQCSECIQLIEDGSVGLGQMFRYLNKLPTFSLLDAGRSELMDNSSNNDVNEFHGGLWRTYELQCEELTCLIHEEFHKDSWNII